MHTKMDWNDNEVLGENIYLGPAKSKTVDGYKLGMKRILNLVLE